MNGATFKRSQSTTGRSDPPVKPTSEVAHQPGQQPAAASRDRWAYCRKDMNLMHVIGHCPYDLPADDFCDICPEAHLGYWATGHSAWAMCYLLKSCGLEAQRRSARGETKSAGETTDGARGGSRLGNPCDEDGLTR